MSPLEEHGLCLEQSAGDGELGVAGEVLVPDDELMQLVLMSRDYPLFLISRFLKLRKLRAESLRAPKKLTKTFR